jgi:hypothetical protein
MTSTLTPSRSHPDSQNPGSRLRGGPTRRSVPHLLLGVLLVTSCTAGAVVWSTNAGQRRGALMLARPVALGHVLEPADLREVAIAVEGGVDAIPVEDTSSVIGTPLAASLPAGVLLPRGALGAAPVPAAGRAVAALALQPGQVTPDLTAGASVLVVASTDPAAGTPDQPAGVEWTGVVLGLTSGASDGEFVVSVELDEDDARAVAAVPVGRLSVVVVAGGDR